MATATKQRKKTTKKFNPAVAEQKREEAMLKLEQSIAFLLNSDTYKQWLVMTSELRTLRGNSYSWQNSLMIMMQNPNATICAGFHDWIKIGRSIKKGAKGIAIRAPFTKKLEEVDEATGEQKRFTYFNLVYVFDISQTDGEDIPELVSPLQGNDEGLYSALVKSAIEFSIPVSEEYLNSCNGYCKFNEAGEKVEKVVVSAFLSPLHKAKTLSHELGHALTHGGIDYAAHRPQCELEAESIAFVVLNHFGLNSGNYSFGYISSYNGDNSINQLKESASKIQSTSNIIISWIEDSVNKSENIK